MCQGGWFGGDQALIDQTPRANHPPTSDDKGPLRILPREEGEGSIEGRGGSGFDKNSESITKSLKECKCGIKKNLISLE